MIVKFRCEYGVGEREEEFEYENGMIYDMSPNDLEEYLQDELQNWVLDTIDHTFEIIE